MGRKKVGDGWKSRQKEHQARHKAKMGEKYHEYHREWYRKNADRMAIRRKELVYGITEAQILALYVEQGGKCAICLSVMQMTGHSGAHIDHDHETGLVRGLLCRRCNTGLGLFGDNPSTLTAAADYLEKFRR